MIILVRGTADSNSENYADRITAALAANSALTYGKKTVVLQLSNFNPVENVLYGKRFKESSIASESYQIDDSGLDAIIRRLSMGRLTDEQFADCGYTFNNCLNIVGPSKETDIAKTLAGNPNLLKEILVNANEIYNTVYVFVRGRDAELRKALISLNMIQKEIVCVPQGNAIDEEVKRDKEIETLYAVKNFDEGSIFTLRTMAKSYNTKNIYPIPYNVAFKDACLSESAWYFFNMNINPTDSDDNGRLISCISALNGSVTGITEPYIKERHFVIKKK